MTITWKTWDRALEGIVNGMIASDTAPDATVKAMSGAIHDLLLSRWEASDFSTSGGAYSNVRNVTHEIVWRRGAD